MKTLFTIILFFIPTGCSNGSDDNILWGHKYIIFIGNPTQPKFDELKLGMTFDQNSIITAYASGEFGKITIYKNGEKEGIYKKGSLAYAFNKGDLLIEGELIKQLKFFVLQQKDSDTYTLVDKKKLKKDNEFSYSKEIEE